MQILFLVRLLWCGKKYLQNIVSLEEEGSKHFFKRLLYKVYLALLYVQKDENVNSQIQDDI